MVAWRIAKAGLLFCAGEVVLVQVGWWEAWAAYVAQATPKTGGHEMLMKACPRCKKLIPHGRTYCEACAPIAEALTAEKRQRAIEYRRQKYNKDYNNRRDTKYLTFYRSKDWKTLSRAKLQACDYKCELQLEGCTRIAVEVDHIQAIQTDEGWEKRLDWDNLQGVCTNCHNRKHDRFKKKNEDGVVDLRTLER